MFCVICCDVTTINPCPRCGDPTRDRTLVCVVQEPLDVLAIERAGWYHGRYHVLHGAITPVEGLGPEQLRIKELLARVAASRQPGGGPPIAEVILALHGDIAGRATAMYLWRQLAGVGVAVRQRGHGALGA